MGCGTIWAYKVGSVKHQARDLRENVGKYVRVQRTIPPLTGTSIFLNMVTPFRTSEIATSCGVDTMTAPEDQRKGV